MMTNSEYEAQFKGHGDVDTHYEYSLGFGELNNKSAYNGFFKANGSSKLQTKGADYIKAPQVYLKHCEGLMADATHTKALDPTTGTTPTNAGQVIVPVAVDREFTNLTIVDTPLRSLIRRVSNMGLTADYNQITALGAGNFLPLNSAIPPSNETYARQYTPLKYMYIRGGVMGQAEAGMSGFFNVSGMNLEVQNKTQAMYQLEEDTIINGDVSSDALEFSGLIKLVTDGGQTDNNAGAAVTLDEIKALATKIYKAKGLPGLIVTDGDTMDAITKQIEDQYRQADRRTGAFGMEFVMLHHYTGQIPMVVDYFMPTTATARALLMLDMRHIEMRVLLDYTLVPLAVTRDATEFFIKAYLALIVKAITFQGIIYNIA